MNNNDLMRFYELYGQLASATQTADTDPDITAVKAVMKDIAELFRLTKGEIHFYSAPGDEALGMGDTTCCFDSGKEGVPVHSIRFTTNLLPVISMTVYMSEGDSLSDEERQKIDLTMRTVLSYISRLRMKIIAERLAFYDDMGFCNIRSFFNYLTKNSAAGMLDGKASMIYNLRHFSLINDEFGRNVGDTVLWKHYEQIRSMTGESGIVSRLGGDAFVCVCDKARLPDIIDYLTEAVIPFGSEGNTVTIAASVGVFVIPDGFSVHSPNDIMGKIMHAFNIAKRDGQEYIIYYSDELVADRDRTKRIQQQFPEALKNGEFKVFYQPKVNTLTGEVCGGEALCRWLKNGEIIPPAEFIPVLEETKDICRLDFYVLEQVCKDLRRWLGEGRKAVRISVNLSRRHMINDKLAETIIEIIDRYRIPHRFIEIELTETTTDVEFKDLRRVVNCLQAQGICTSVDDFGMGYSSLNLIRVIPWNVLKIDRTFLPLDDEEKDSIRNIMFRHVVAMTKEMGLECIVEGVETSTQLNVLKENKCEQAQGFLFDKPLPVEEFEKRLDMERYPLS